MSRPEKRTVVDFDKVSKIYRLYDSIGDHIWSLTGLDRFRFWQKTRFMEFPALDDLTFSIQSGERIGIVGRNGAGKTTLLKVLSGALRPTTGSVRVDGPVQALMQIGLGFHPDFSGYENMCSSLIYNGLNAEQTENAIEEIVDFVELGDFLHQPFKTYSLGMRSRLQFATATAIHPDILVIDEVLGAGDAYFSAKSADRVKRLTSSGCTLFLVSHGMQQVLQFCDRVLWLDGGSLVMDGPALDVVNAYEEFIHAVLDEIGSVDPEDKGTNSALPKWMRDKLLEEVLGRRMTPSGSTATRWGGEGPLKVKDLRVIDENHEPLARAKPGESFGVAIDIESEQPGTFPLAAAIVIYDENGHILCRLVDKEEDRTFEAGQMITVIAWMKSPIIGAGEYVFSASLHANWNPMTPNASLTYDIFGRASKLQINDSQYNPGRVLLTADWQTKDKRALHFGGNIDRDGRGDSASLA
ncbi:MAG: ABC transporter ATP-binding protein [Geminicoccaceae bacterium]